MKIYTLSAATVLLLCTHIANAVELSPVIVTATRTAQTTDETLASVTVITRKDIERQQAQTVQDLFRSVPGVNITNNGGAGKATSFFLRGTESDHVLVLIDGIKVGSATSGAVAFQHIPVEQIERIEIVRGPRSSLYGSEAIGGVIQIFTRKGGKEFKPFFSIGAGSDDTYKISAGITGGSKRGWFSLSADATDTNGFNACNGRPSPGGAGCFTTEPDKDGYRNVSGALRAGYQFRNGLEIDAHVLQSNGKSEFDGGFVNESESVQQVVGGALKFSPLSNWHMTLTAGRSLDESDNFKNGTYRSRFNTERDNFSLQNDFSLAENHLLTLGADYQDDEVESLTVYTESSRNNSGLFGQYQGTFDSHDVQLSLRSDDNEQFGKHTTGSAAWGYEFDNHLRLTAAYGTAFKAPTFNELYFPGFGNSDLGPEESRSTELSLSGNANWGDWSVNVYETLIDDLIAFDASISAPANVNKARIQGVELVLNTELKGWAVSSNLTFLNPEDHSGGANDGNELPRRAKQSFNINADKDFGKYTLGAALHAVSKSYDDLANTREIDGYTTMDLRGEYSLTRDWRLQARVENLFDENYERASFYNQAGRGFYLTLRYQP